MPPFVTGVGPNLRMPVDAQHTQSKRTNHASHDLQPPFNENSSLKREETEIPSHNSHFIFVYLIPCFYK